MLEELSDPIRMRLARRLERGDASLCDLAAAAGVHVNTARTHLAAMEHAGVLERSSAEPCGRGRPPAMYRLAPGLAARDLGGLAGALASVIVRGGVQVSDVRTVGREWGMKASSRTLPDTLDGLGFDAELDDDVLLLHACPCALVSPDRPELVCELVVGVAEGQSGMTVCERRHDPVARTCSARLRPRENQ
jgi:predicted ArsR family transcriptional regulator